MSKAELHDDDDEVLGRRKIVSGGGDPPQRCSIYPIVPRSDSGEAYVFTATLVDSVTPSRVAVIGPNAARGIEILQNMGCYGYTPENNGKVGSGSVKPTRLYLFDAEVRRAFFSNFDDLMLDVLPTAWIASVACANP